MYCNVPYKTYIFVLSMSYKDFQSTFFVND
jgi:hypothetical protein